MLLGLLSVIKTIKEEFQKTASRRTSINLSLILFLRSDIFNFIMEQARERDKISYSLLNWDDKELLLRVIEERVLSAFDVPLTPSDIWTKYFCSTVRKKPIKDYLLECIIPRPRDIIYICKASIGEAVTRAHTIVEEQDVLGGEKKYSQYVFDSLLVENGIRVEELEKILYEFAGAKKVLSHTDTTCILRKAGVGQEEIDNVINILLDLTFLGLEIEENVFVFLYNENDKQKYHVLARKLVDSLKTKEKRYAINRPFHTYLEIKD